MCTHFQVDGGWFAVACYDASMGDHAKSSPRSKNDVKKTFNTQDFLDSAGVARKVQEFAKKEKIFAQGDPCKNVLYIQKGGVRLSVVNESGKEAVVAVFGIR